MTITITGEEHEVLWEEAEARLTGIDAVWYAVAEGDFEAADRISREYLDFLRVLVEGLGWGERGGGDAELRAPTDVLRRSLRWMREGAVGRATAETDEPCQTGLLIRTCAEVLARLDREAVR
jgi:hypothetical protein